ncbi:hypothetical protein ANCCEY_00450 [Ancylostoma ceylanicum]|uniref:Cysteine rich repeat-containing domain protein n=2 Tax=Ancylostoma ceylanicum TaxID=53326 RepID=A0A0D6MAC2_9BILA|nr:hypothetical protein ANCCEY_00450 [Ancylostoma ceylanicum]EYC40740.1 hypothetical protein Y032_0599g469 [Ancylostoma ceylanicum]
MHMVLVFGLVLLVALTEQAIPIRQRRLCPCAAQLPSNFCSCQAGHSPLCSCKAIVPTPTCACGVQALVSECQASCQQTCQSTCPIHGPACPSSCGSTCARSCTPIQVVAVSAIPRTIVPAQCPGFCQQSCQGSCGAHPIPSSCVPQCRQTCGHRCEEAAPHHGPIHVVAEPHAAVAPAPAGAGCGPACAHCGAGRSCPATCAHCGQAAHAAGHSAQAMPSQMHPGAAGQPHCPEACMPNCDPECIMKHQAATPLYHATSPLPDFQMQPSFSTFAPERKIKIKH